MPRVSRDAPEQRCAPCLTLTLVARCCFGTRVGFGVSNTESMLDALVAVALPGTNTVGFYRTSPTDWIRPTLVRARAIVMAAVSSIFPCT
jgi:hypothetical protein